MLAIEECSTCLWARDAHLRHGHRADRPRRAVARNSRRRHEIEIRWLRDATSDRASHHLLHRLLVQCCVPEMAQFDCRPSGTNRIHGCTEGLNCQVQSNTGWGRYSRIFLNKYSPKVVTAESSLHISSMEILPRSHRKRWTYY